MGRAMPYGTLCSAAPMIHPYDNASQTRWDRGDFKVQLILPETTRPMGFCDGTPEDMAELRAMAEAESTTVEIEVKVLKTGREIWTLRGKG